MTYMIELVRKSFNDTQDHKKKIFNAACLCGILLSAANVLTCILYYKPISILINNTLMLVGCTGVFIYANLSQNYQASYKGICYIISIIGLPTLTLMTGHYHSSAIYSSANYYYVIGLVLPFLMLEGKTLFRFVVLEIIIFVTAYGLEYYLLGQYACKSVSEQIRYLENVLAILVVGLTLGAEFYYQLHVYQKKQEENDKQKIMLQQMIAEINTAKQEAEVAKREAEGANKAKSEFLANMSHEIRTPMNAILGMATLISRDDINMKVRERIEHIETATRSLLVIVNDILDISKIESGKMKIVEGRYQPFSLINDVINIIQYHLEDRPIKLNTSINKTLPCELYGDSVRIRQIMINLLSNAEKYTHEGEINFIVDWIMEGDFAKLIIKVQDTGIGIKEDDIERLFNSFERVDEEKNHSLEGTGLGLSICRKLLDLMGGDISVESEYGKGSTFTVVLNQSIVNHKPIEALDYSKTEDARKEDSFKAPEAKILVVDDNLVNLRVAQGLLQIYDIQIDTASSGKEALELLACNYYDLVFMDHMMPGLDGIETLRIIQREQEKYNQDIPIVALTANAVSGVREIFLEKGFKEYLAKPIEAKKLNRILLDFLPAHFIQKKEQSSIPTPDPLHEVDHCKLGEQISKLRVHGIDIEKGLKQVEYNEALYIDILKVYYKETLRLKEELQDTKNQDNSYFVTRIHAIKGSSENLGITKIAERAKRLEKAALLEDYLFIKEKYPKFEEQVEKTLVLLKNFLDEIEEGQTTEERIYQEMLEQKQLESLRSGFEAYDIEKIETALKALQVYQYTEEIERFLEHLEECMENLEYEQGVMLIDGYVEGYTQV